MTGSTVLAGGLGLPRPVRGINIIEVPDVWNWLQGGELLLSAGFAWLDDPQQMDGLAAKLNDLDVSGIAFKLGPYLERVPDVLLRQADELGLPVISLPHQLAYREILESLYGKLAAKRVDLDIARQSRQAFLHASLDEQSIDKVVSTLARQLGCWTGAFDLLDEVVITSDGGGTTDRAPFDALDERTTKLVEQLPQLGMRRTPARIVVDAEAALGAALVVGHRTHGYLVASAEAGFDDRAVDAMAQAGELVSFLLMNRLALFEGRRQSGDVFLRSLISDTLTSEEAAERAITFGLRLTRPCFAFVLGALRPSTPDQSLDLAARRLDRVLTSTPHVFGTGPGGDTLLGLVQFEAPYEGMFARLINVLQSSHERGSIATPIVGAGAPGTGIVGVRRSHNEALIAYEAGQRLRVHGFYPFDGLRVERLLAQIPRGPLAEGYVASLLSPLDYEPELLRTVEVYLQHGGNKVATAAAMPLHRSSLIYRLRKAADLLDVDLNAPEHCLELWLAIRLRRILNL